MRAKALQILVRACWAVILSAPLVLAACGQGHGGPATPTGNSPGGNSPPATTQADFVYALHGTFGNRVDGLQVSNGTASALNGGYLDANNASDIAAGRGVVALSLWPYPPAPANPVLSIWRSDAQTGALSQLGSTLYPLNVSPPGHSLVMNRAGTVVYAALYSMSADLADRGPKLATYSISAAGVPALVGSLFPIGTNPMEGLAYPVLTPDERFLFLSTIDTNGIPQTYHIYRLNLGSQEGQVVSSTAVVGDESLPYGGPFTSLAITPSGQFLFAIHNTGVVGAGNIAVFRIDSSTGALTSVPGSPFAGGQKPVALTIDGTGKYVYVVDEISTATVPQGWILRGFAFDSQTGGLSKLAASPWDLSGRSSAIVTTQSGFLVTGANSQLMVSRIDGTTGSLVPAAGSPVGASELTEDLFVLPH